MTAEHTKTSAALPVPVPVRVRLDALGHGSFQVDGVEMSKTVAGVNIISRAGEVNEILVSLSSRGGVEWDGYARVYVEEREPVDPGPAAAVFLQAIDAEELEKAALNRLDLASGPHSLTAAMLRQLTEWASGRA